MSRTCRTCTRSAGRFLQSTPREGPLQSVPSQTLFLCPSLEASLGSQRPTGTPSATAARQAGCWGRLSTSQQAFHQQKDHIFFPLGHWTQGQVPHHLPVPNHLCNAAKPHRGSQLAPSQSSARVVPPSATTACRGPVSCSNPKRPEAPRGLSLAFPWGRDRACLGVDAG